MKDRVFDILYNEKSYVVYRYEQTKDVNHIVFELLINDTFCHNHNVNPLKEKKLKREIMRTIYGYIEVIRAKGIKDSQQEIDMKEIIKSLKHVTT